MSSNPVMAMVVDHPDRSQEALAAFSETQAGNLLCFTSRREFEEYCQRRWPGRTRPPVAAELVFVCPHEPATSETVASIYHAGVEYASESSANRWGSQLRRRRQQLDEVARRYQTLNDAEHQVLELIVAGYPNKVIARRMEVSSRTVDRLRASVFKKMGADSAVNLTRIMTEYRILRGNADNQVATPSHSCLPTLAAGI